jgi:autotransporter-associated beta strand protein
VNSVKFFQATADTLTLSGATTIGTGGILVSSALNGVAEIINGAGTLAGSSGGDLIVLENDPNGSLTISNQIIDSTSTSGLTKSGPGTLVLSNNDNTYSGVTTINGGILSVSSLAPGGSPSSIGESNNGPSNLQFYGGTLQYTGAATSTDRDFTVGPQGGTIDASGSGALNLSSVATVGFADPTTPSAVTFTLTGTSTAANSFSPLLSDPGTGQNVLNLIKNGGGTWVLPNANTYSGGTTINAGVLSVQNTTPSGSATGSGAVTVNANGTLGGVGFVGGPVTVNAGGSLAPGDGPGTLTINNNVVLNTGVNLGNTAAGLGFALNTPSVSGGSGGNDFATLSGNLTINPDLTLQATPGTAFGAGTYVLMHYGTGLTDSSNGFTGWNALLSSVPANLPSGSAYTMDFLSDTAHDNVDLVVSTTTPGTPPVLGPPASSGGGANGHSSTVIVQQASTTINNSLPGNPALQINVPVKNGNIGGNNNNNNNGANFVNFNFFIARGAQAAAKAFAVGWAPVVVQIAPTTPYYNVGGVPPDTAGFENASAPGWAYAGTIPTNPAGGAPGLPDTGIPVNSVANNQLPNAGGMAILPYPGANPAGNPVPPAGDDWLPAFTIAPVLFVVDPPAVVSAQAAPTYYGESFDTALAPLPLNLSSIHLALVENNGAEDGLATSDDTDNNGNPGADAKADYQGSFLSLVDSTPGYSSITSLSQLGPSDWLNFDGSYGTDMTNDIAWAVEDDPDVDLDVVGNGQVPEPTSLVVIGAGACGMLLRRRRRIA